MDDVDAWIVGIEETRNEDISRGLRWKSGEDFGPRYRLHLAIQEPCPGRTLFTVAGHVSFQLVVVLFLVLGKVVLDF